MSPHPQKPLLLSASGVLVRECTDIEHTDRLQGSKRCHIRVGDVIQGHRGSWGQPRQSGHYWTLSLCTTVGANGELLQTQRPTMHTSYPLPQSTASPVLPGHCPVPVSLRPFYAQCKGLWEWEWAPWCMVRNDNRNSDRYSQSTLGRLPQSFRLTFSSLLVFCLTPQVLEVFIRHCLVWTNVRLRTLAGLSELKWRDRGSVWGATRSNKKETNSRVELRARLGLQGSSPVEKEPQLPRP